MSTTKLGAIQAGVSWQKAYRDGLVSYRSFFETCLANSAHTNELARIPIEGSAADLVLVAGGDDELWPSEYFVRELASWKESSGRPATLIFDQDAGIVCYFR